MGVEVDDRATQADEHRLITAAQAGDRSAFAALVEVYWPRLYRWLHLVAHDRHLAEDLAQDAFLKAWTNLHRFQAGTNFRAWLFRIAHNALANQRRASRLRAPLPEDLPGGSPGPEEQVISREALTRLAREVQRLPLDHRAALLLRVEEDLSFRQIAAVLDTTEETARWRVFKARQKLLERFPPEDAL